MKKKALIVILIVCLFPVLGISKSQKVTFFSPKSFYIYASGSWVYNVSPGYSKTSVGRREKPSAFVPFIGFGYTILKAEKRLHVNLEFDYASADFDFPGNPGRKIDFYTLIVNVELKISARIPFSLYSGFGLSGIDYPQGNTYYFDEHYIVPRNDFQSRVPLSFGVKISLTKHVLLRAEARNYTYGIGDDSYYYYSDSTPVSLDFGSEANFGSVLALGLEYHL